MPIEIAFAGGGTGGHLYPGLAVANAVVQLRPDALVTFFTTNRPLDAEILGRTSFGRQPQSVQPFTLRPTRWLSFWRAWRESVRAARRAFEQRRPAAVLGLGGYAAGPPVVAAHALGIRSAILNPDAIPGRANRFLAGRVDRVFAQWAASRGHFPARAGLVQVTGCPIRAEFSHADGAASRARFGLDPRRPMLLVTGASQGARTINEAMYEVWPRFAALHAEWQLVHLTGAADEATAREAYARSGPGVKVLAFTHEMAGLLAAADMVVSRAGASTLAELAALGKPSILLPYPYHKDDHQTANARVLLEAGAALLVRDMRDTQRTSPALFDALHQLADADRRAAFARAAHGLGLPHAARDVAEWLLGAAVPAARG